MVFINSNEKLIFQNIQAAFSRLHQNPLIFYAESDNSVWLEMETLIERMKSKEMQDDLSYYYIISSPINIFDIYAHLKMIWQLAKGFVTKRLNFHIIIAFSNKEILTTEQLNSDCALLYEQLNQLTTKRNVPFSFETGFYFAYNVFGESRFTNTIESNEIQQFINIHNEGSSAYLMIDPSLFITGTDVQYLCDTIIQQSLQRIKNGPPVIKRDSIPLQPPVSVKELVSHINRGTYNFQDSGITEQELNQTKESIQQFQGSHTKQPLVNQILSYIR